MVFEVCNDTQRVSSLDSDLAGSPNVQTSSTGDLLGMETENQVVDGAVGSVRGRLTPLQEHDERQTVKGSSRQGTSTTNISMYKHKYTCTNYAPLASVSFAHVYAPHPCRVAYFNNVSVDVPCQ